jgi:hypothetical protein
MFLATAITFNAAAAITFDRRLNDVAMSTEEPICSHLPYFFQSLHYSV